MVKLAAVLKCCFRRVHRQSLDALIAFLSTELSTGRITNAEADKESSELRPALPRALIRLPCS
jgi:hypothetical protein